MNTDLHLDIYTHLIPVTEGELDSFAGVDQLPPALCSAIRRNVTGKFPSE
jgi:hypothetical protein